MYHLRHIKEAEGFLRTGPIAWKGVDQVQVPYILHGCRSLAAATLAMPVEELITGFKGFSFCRRAHCCPARHAKPTRMTRFWR